MIRRFAALLLVGLLLAALAAGVPAAAAPMATLGLVVADASIRFRRQWGRAFPERPALFALVSSHRLPRASLIVRHI